MSRTELVPRSLCCLSLVVVIGCSRPATHVMPMRDIPRAQQDQDREACDRVAGTLDVTKPLTGSMRGQLVYAAGGAGVGLLISPLFASGSNDPKEVALIVLGGAGVGAAIGFVIGAMAGWQSGLERAGEEYVNAYAACMRERGYTIIRERR